MLTLAFLFCSLASFHSVRPEAVAIVTTLADTVFAGPRPVRFQVGAWIRGILGRCGSPARIVLGPRSKVVFVEEIEPGSGRRLFVRAERVSPETLVN